MQPTPSPDTIRELAQQSYLAVERIGVASVVLVLLLAFGFATLFILVAPLVRSWNKRSEIEIENRKAEREEERRLHEKQLEAHEKFASVVATNTEVLNSTQNTQHQQIDKLTVYTLTVDKTTNAIVGKIDTLHTVTTTNGEKLDRVLGTLVNVLNTLATVNDQLKSLLKEIDDDGAVKSEHVPAVASTNNVLPPIENLNPT